MRTLITLIVIATIALGGLNGFNNTIDHAQQHNKALYSAMNK